MAADPDRHRFLIVFDREGYSPAFFAQLWTEHRIAAVTYCKGAYEPWDHARFTTHRVALPFGNEMEMDLAETSDTTIAGVRLREIRRLSCNHKHQSAMITTCRNVAMVPMAAHLFSRWSQENDLHFATRDLSIDSLAGYLPAAAPEDAEVRNPVWRRLDRQARRLRSERAAIIAERGRLVLIGNDPADVAAYIAQGAAIQQRLDACHNQIDVTNASLRTTSRRVQLRDLPEAERPKLISPHRQRFITTLKIIAYRAESAICSILRQHLAHTDEARTLAKAIWGQTADLIPDDQAGTLTVRLHHFPSPQVSRVVDHLLDHLNQADVEYPGTGLRLRYTRYHRPFREVRGPETLRTRKFHLIGGIGLGRTARPAVNYHVLSVQPLRLRSFHEYTTNGTTPACCSGLTTFLSSSASPAPAWPGNGR